MDYPPITAVVTTYITTQQRKEVVERTLMSWGKYLYYEGEINLILSDDGSSQPFHPSWSPDPIWTRQDRRGVGASLNAGFNLAFRTSPIVLYAVDDWSLTEPLDLTPWVRLLMERDDVGLVRLGPPHPNLTGKVEMVTSLWQGWGLRLDKKGLVVAQRPALWHKRMIDAYGWFQEQVSALECERLYNEHFCQADGPDAVLVLPHPWLHIESESLSSLTP